MQEKAKGKLMIIGGNEDKKGDCYILKSFVSMCGGEAANIAIVTTATEQPQEVGEEYKEIFARLGAGSTKVLYMDNRQAADNDEQINDIIAATGVFFTGGDQLRLTSILGGSRVNAAIKSAYENGTVIAGTSAGASVMSDTMIVGGDSSDTPKKETREFDTCLSKKCP